MGFPEPEPEPKGLVAIQQQQEPARATDGSIAWRNKRKGSPCQQGLVAHGSVASLARQEDESSQGDPAEDYSGPHLPEDIWCHIHSLMPLRDAARAACVSRAFKFSWRCYPKLTFSEETLGLDGHVNRNADARAFTTKVDHILEKHSGIGIKTLELLGALDYNAKDRCYLDKWLQMAITPVLEELWLYLFSVNNKYEFPCLVLSHGNAVSLRRLRLSNCTFRPTVGLCCCLRSLTILNLFQVLITGDELGSLLSSSFALERLELRHCEKISCLMIPCLLLRLNYLEVLYCKKLRIIENKAPNLTHFTLVECKSLQVQLSHLESFQMKSVYMDCPGVIGYIRVKLAPSMPNLQSLLIYSSEMVDAPMSSKFLHLKYLNIILRRGTFSLNYDYLSLASFLGASPSLETFILNVWELRMEHVSASTDLSEPREMPGHNHDKLKNVRIDGFYSTKSLIELACHIVHIATLLESLILDT
ncbi:F-box/FBD/LRR-repeat protein At3g26920 isoform X2 [Triticum aestivum]|uniref:F-box/FBD/LRR-repeat protein At3g26920 isoform X2 n=1 Tax=Triticum aestivum TaxID=4565 RepID=UPI001D021196|nr:F-box/FBD/LRR-repeat protein At3g26920-like isoform X2 [Triticum aestivum]